MTESAIVGGESSSSRLTRPYMFSEFFAGFGSFTTAVSSLDEALVKTTVAHDGYQDEWNILRDDHHFDTSVKICTEVDYAHFAPPCRTYTEARRSGDVRMVVLCLTLFTNVEQPFQSRTLIWFAYLVAEGHPTSPQDT